jgi:bifunctional UDP-N-acetylglucosamine pyrophosphorylase/glucosamine-1-phosphate N-acetyltransferase
LWLGQGWIEESGLSDQDPSSTIIHDDLIIPGVSMSTVAVILAAGLGKRMKSTLPKVLHPILGDAVLLWVLRALPGCVHSAIVVVHSGKEKVEEALALWRKQGLLPCPVSTVDQGEPLGTGHAVQMTTGELDRLGAEKVLILSGDVPLLEASTVAKLAASEGALLAMDLEDPAAYGRVVQHPDGTLLAITEHKDASAEIRAIRRVNGGAYTLPWKALKPALACLRNDNSQGEFYLTDAVVTVGRQVPIAVELCDPAELLGMNSRKDQAVLQALARNRVNGRWMDAGVTLLDPDTTLVGPRVRLAQDVLVEPGVCLEGTVTVGEGTRIGQGCVIRDCTIAPEVEIKPYCVIQQSEIGPGAKVGPFAHLREGSLLHAQVHVGNFVETKKTTLHPGAKANHLSYLGDAEIGERTNIGAGFISCNYDGFSKHRTTIGKDVFVGSDCQLVAPVTLGDSAIIGAGSTITVDIPPHALALARAPLIVKEGAADRLREKLRAKRDKS